MRTSPEGPGPCVRRPAFAADAGPVVPLNGAGETHLERDFADRARGQRAHASPAPFAVRLRNVRLAYDEFSDLDERAPGSGEGAVAAYAPPMASYDTIPGLEHVYLEDSWVLGVHESVAEFELRP